MNETAIDWINSIRLFFQEPKDKILLGTGALLTIFSAFILLRNPQLYFPSPFLILFIPGILFVLLPYWLGIREKQEISLSQLKKQLESQEGYTIRFRNTKVRIRVGNIEKTPFEVSTTDRNTGIVLPLIHPFTKNDLLDTDSSTGAFVKEHYQTRVDSLQETIRNFAKPTDQSCRKGDTIILPKEYEIHGARVMFVRTLQRKEKKIVGLEPEEVFISIRNIFKRASKEKIVSLFMPIIGSGRAWAKAKLDIPKALNLLVLASYLYSTTLPESQVKNVNIIFYKEDYRDLTRRDLERVRRLVYMTLLELG
ncbi:hypothetical protein AKJ37_03545 [candidate division MSBL1 archaeon SCGC-AAA259I09]|uniref:Macro domain-containing protein n=1 Tax=candidate division MSBL1 archaeon SCGC-AAA259I09 TaxID=1698267 RepID=A0A133USQ5_9EURY|nr:hypothetical protein AKJ37_03545 [candidate division MSBL1 archaeon SCGC-AAA259I09]